MKTPEGTTTDNGSMTVNGTSTARTKSHVRSTRRNRQLRILILEDVKADAELMVRALRRSGLEFAAHYVAGKESFHRQLDEFVPDLVLSDYEMPRYSGMDAIADVHAHSPDTPVIIVTGAVSDETAVDCIEAGAEDYVLKDHLARLPTAVAKALERRSEHHRRVEAEATVARLSEGVEPSVATAPITKLPDHGLLVERLGELLGGGGVARPRRRRIAERRPLPGHQSQLRLRRGGRVARGGGPPGIGVSAQGGDRDAARGHRGAHRRR